MFWSLFLKRHCRSAGLRPPVQRKLLLFWTGIQTGYALKMPSGFAQSCPKDESALEMIFTTGKGFIADACTAKLLRNINSPQAGGRILPHFRSEEALLRSRFEAWRKRRQPAAIGAFKPLLHLSVLHAPIDPADAKIFWE